MFCEIDNLHLIAWLLVVRTLKVPEKGPKKVLIDAAAQLVMEKGFDSVSIRDITGAAKANVAAVNYHFGSREGLLDVLAMQILEPLCSERIKALESAERQRAGKLVAVEQILKAYIHALFSAAELAKMSRESFILLAGKTLCLPSDRLSPVVALPLQDVSGKFRSALARALDSADEELLAKRWEFFDCGLNQSLQATNGAIPDETVDEWMDFASRGFTTGAAPQKPSKPDPQGQLFDF